MYYKLIHALVVLFILTIPLSLPAAAQTSPLQYDDALEITTAHDAGTASQTLSVTVADSEITNLLFTPGDLVDSAGNLAAAAEAITLTPNPVEQLAANTSLDLTVSIGSLPDPGTYTGEVTITYDQQPEGAGEAITLQLIVAEPTVLEAGSSASDQSTELDLVIATKPGGPAEDILFRIMGSDTSASIPLFIRQSGDTEVSNVRLFAHLADEDGQQLTGVSFSLTIGGSDVTQTGLTIPAGGKSVLATLNVTNLSATGTFAGNLVAEHDGKVVEVAVLKGERFPLPVLETVGASDAGEISLTSRVAALEARLRLESTNLGQVEELKIIVDDFSDPNGNRIPVTWTVDGQPGEGAQIDVPGLGSVELVITAELPAAGEYTSAITLLYADKRETVNLKVDHPLPDLRIVGASEAKEISLTSRVAALKASLRLESTNLTEVADLQIIVDDLIDPDGNRIPVTWTVDGQPGEAAQIAVPGLGSVELEIEARLPTAGEHTGAITLVYADKRDTFSLKVNRTRPAPTASIEDVQTVLGQADSILPWVGRDNIKLWLTLHETGGQQVTLNLPQFSVLSLKGAEENTFQAQFEGLEVRGEDDEIVAEPFTIEPDQIKRLQLNVRGLSQAGAYIGKLTLTVPDAPAIEEDVTILVKESAWIAGLWIGLSVIVSFFIGVWLKSIRPKLERQQYANRLLSDLGREEKRVTEASPGEKKLAEVLEDLRFRLEDLCDDADLGTDTKAEDVLKEIDKKITLFRPLVDAYQQVYTLEPKKLIELFRQDLETIHQQMLARDLNSATTAESSLDNLFNKIKTEVQKELVQQLTDFETEVKAQIKIVSQATRDKLEKIPPVLGKARGFAEQTPEPQLAAASLELNEARVTYARAMAEDLKASLQDPPLGFDQNSWTDPKQEIQRLVDAVGDEKDGEGAIVAYQKAYTFYLSTLVEKFTKCLKADRISIDQLEQGGKIKKAQADTLRATVDSLLTSLDGALTKTKEGDLTTARTAYQTTKQTYTQKVQPELSKSGARMGSGFLASLGVALAAGGFVPAKVNEGQKERSPERRPRQREGIAKLISLGDLIVNLVALVMAIAFGLKLLWAGNATWGGFDDHLVALLWSFGIQQVSSQGVKSVDDIISTWKS
jgi:hypothetical protein